MQKLTTKAQQQGQALVLALCLIIVGMGTVFILYNTGQTAAEKARLVNAADAAAYSGAVYMARNLNFMAYTNRAMIANHVMVGHTVSYVSWVRMVDDSTDSLDPLASVLGAIPYIGYILEALLEASIAVTEVIAPIVKQLAELFAKVYVPFVELTNQGYHLAQKAASAYLLTSTYSGGTMNKLMNKTAQVYNDKIKIKGIDEFVSDVADNSTQSHQVKLIAVQAVSDFNKVQGFLKSYNADDDDGRIKQLTLDSLGSSKEWIENRNGMYFAVIIPLPKTGSTELTMEGTDSGDTDWEAEDNMAGGVFGSGEAKATDYLDSYTGVPGYYDIKDIDSPQDITLPLTVFATMPFDQARIFRVLGMKASIQEFSTVSRAEVYHKRPDDSSRFESVGEHGEYPNVFNPFWEARLIKNNVIPTF